MSAIEIEDIFKILPHRYPFLMVDRVTDISLAKDIRGYKNVTINELFFEGHFPNKPIMPGVMIIEAMAQLSGILALYTRRGEGIVNEDHSYIYYLAGTDKTRFKRPVAPGDRLQMQSSIVNMRRDTVKFSCTAHVEEELACSSDMLCVGRYI